jgi:putative ABC transport system permease protein
MFWDFVTAAVRYRRRRLLLAFSALAVAATLATALFSVYTDIDRKMRVEFRGYGANLILAPAGQARTIPLRAVELAERLGAIAAPFLYTVGRMDHEPVVLAGVDFSRAGPLIGYWRGVPQGLSLAPGECLAGASVASHFHLAEGQKAELESGACTIRGILSTGGAEDAQVVLAFDAVARIAGVTGAASMVQVRADGERLSQIQAALAKALPEADVRTLHAVAETEANVVFKVRSSLYLLTALILGITTLCVSSNFSALVIERSKEIGILKAIGAAEKKIAALFLSESLLLGLGSTVAGYAGGLLVAWWIGRVVFPGSAGMAVGVNFGVFLPVAGVTLAVAFAATLAAAARIWKIRPAVILRGE